MITRTLTAVHTLSQPFLDGLAKGTLRYQVCKHCKAAQSLARWVCFKCGGDEIEWRDASGTGGVIAVTIISRAPSDSFRGLVPYALAMVQLDQGPRVMGHIDKNAQVRDRVAFSVFQHDGRPLVKFHVMK
ncbi:MAG: OB-fold domain-containing protein [Alcaligenaceae bacterium]|nr:OB-fold domain-containing protein [Alcaligenaceae bacterium]